MDIQGALFGQSNIDLCQQVYGTLDNYIKLLSDNGILLSTNLKPVYSYDSTLGNIDTNNIGFPYNTNTFKTTTFAPIPLMNDDGDILLNDDGQPLYADNAF